MPYTYDYTRTSANESAAKQYWRRMKMALTRSVREKTFQFSGQTYEYLYHPYNRTWKNERGVEIPIFRKLLVEHNDQRVLEVGNVLSHYFPVNHEVVDKYEVSPGVINQDIIEFVPQDRYDLIVSISTLEHVGWDEQPQKPIKLLQAIEHLRTRCLAPSGKLVASLPIGYNRYFDELLNSCKSPFTSQQFMKRISDQNYWIESDWTQCRDVPYGRFVAHAIVIGTIKG